MGGVEVVAASGCGLERDARGAVEEEVAVGHRHGAPPHLARARARAGGEGEGEGVGCEVWGVGGGVRVRARARVGRLMRSG